MMKATTHSCLIALSLALVLTLCLSGAKKVATAPKEGRKVRASARVAEPACTATGYCFFNDGINQWCYTPQTPMLQVGWETD